MIVKPKVGLKVRDPITKAFISPLGHEIGEPDRYWIFRLRDGDVIQIPAFETEPVPNTKDGDEEADAS